MKRAIVFGLFVFLLSSSVSICEERYTGICRANRAEGWEREHFEALAVLPPPTTDIEKCAIYVSKWQNLYYYHSNFYTHASKGVADIYNDSARDDDVRAEALATFRKLEGVVVFRNTSKVALDESNLLKAVALAVYGTAIPTTEKEQSKFVNAYVTKMTFLINPKAADLDVSKLKGAKVAKFRFPTGVVCDRNELEFFREQAKRAREHIGQPTTEVAKSKVYIVTTKDGYIYIHSNYRPLLANGKRAPKPAMLAIRAAHFDNSSAISHLFWNHRIPSLKTNDGAAAWAAYAKAYEQIKFYVEEELQDGTYRQVRKPVDTPKGV